MKLIDIIKITRIDANVLQIHWKAPRGGDSLVDILVDTHIPTTNITMKQLANFMKKHPELE